MAEETQSDLERRALDAETALEEALRERASLWEQLHEQRACEREVEHLREKVAQMEGSPSWRITAPLRRLRRLSQRSRLRTRSER